MAYDRFMVAPLNSGLQTNMRSWLIPEDAFEQLNNAYLFRGRLRKRYGSALMGTDNLKSRLRINLGNTDGFGDRSGTVGAAGLGSAIFKVGQQFSVGSVIFTVISAVAGVQPMLSTDITTAGTFDISNGNYDINSALPATPVYFYPLESVMGITQFETTSITNNPTYAFDTQFAYLFSGGSWGRSGTTIWHGSDSNFFWATNWQGLTPNLTRMFVTNFYAVNPNGAADAAHDDPIYYTDNAGAWTAFTPEFLTTHERVLTARIIVPFKDRLVLLNTIEQNAAHNTNTSYVNRCRFSHNGSPLDANAFLNPGQAGADGGSFLDAPTQEEIISAGFVKDRLIVYFERSTWELAWTGNQVFPFIWQKLNTELGSMSTFSSVPFDKVLFTVGSTGIHVSNGSNVERIDTLIPDQVFEIRIVNNGVFRVAGIRDFFTELVYWSYPISDADALSQTYPNKVLVYNYRTGSWAINDDTITAFGYFEQSNAPTWATSFETWEQALFTWNSGVTQARFRKIVAGNQQGFTYTLEPTISVNAPSLSITNITQSPVTVTTVLTIINHTFEDGEYIKIENTNTELDGNIYQITTAGMTVNTISIGNVAFATPYLGGGTIRRVSYIDILTKRLNPYADKGKNVYLAKVDFAVDKTTNGQLTVDYYPSSTQISLVTDGQASGAIVGSNVLETSPYTLIPLEAASQMLWHPVYFQGDGEFIQLNLYLSDTQMRTVSIVESGLEIEGFVLYCTAVSRLQ